jgi:hypothetical protein
LIEPKKDEEKWKRFGKKEKEIFLNQKYRPTNKTAGACNIKLFTAVICGFL